MELSTIENIIVKFLSQEANTEELNKLSEWISIPENEIVFNTYIDVFCKTNLAFSNPDVEEIKKILLFQIKAEKRKTRKLKVRKSIFRYFVAAMLIGGAFWCVKTDKLFLDPSILEDKLKISQKQNILPGSDKATLTLDDGSQIVLESNISFNTQYAKSNGKTLVYGDNEESKTEVKYNYLTIPRGGEYILQLADGTKVWLNSESQLKFPINFIDGQNRIVSLIYGEAYFEVSSSINHKGAKFIVENNAQQVEVLGTEFNIKAYKDEDDIFTTLVNGKVLVKTGKTQQELAPNQQAKVNETNAEIKISNVDVNTEISWKNGVFSFESKPLTEIMKVLSRWYDIDSVIYQNKAYEKVIFRGVLGKNQSIEEIMSAIKSLSVIDDFAIKDKTIILK